MIEERETLCNLCGKAGGMRCKECKTVYYCSRECQKNDWREHHYACTSLREKHKQDACAVFWGIDNMREIAADEDTEVCRHRALICGFNFGLLGDPQYSQIGEGEGDRSTAAAMMIYDLYSSDYLTSNVIMTDLDEDAVMDIDDFKQQVLSPSDPKKFARGDAFFISLSSDEDVRYAACLVRCPMMGGTEDRYRVFQSMKPHYGLKEWLDSEGIFIFGGALKKEDASSYVECIRLATSDGIVASEAYRKLTGLSDPKIFGLRFYFRHTPVTLPAVYKNSN